MKTRNVRWRHVRAFVPIPFPAARDILDLNYSARYDPKDSADKNAEVQCDNKWEAYDRIHDD